MNSTSNVNDASRNGVPQSKLNPLDEATNLLISWNLAQLCDKFRDEEVCSIAFQHITEADLAELIPKIGPRSIFRTRLTEYRQELTKQKQHINEIESRKRNLQTAFPETRATNNIGATDTSVIKTEVLDSDDQWFREAEDLRAVQDNHHFSDVLDSSASSKQDEENEESDTAYNKRTIAKITTRGNASSLTPQDKTIACYSEQKNNKKLNVKDMLIGTIDGTQVIDYYRENQTLDANHRKKIAKIIISYVIEKRVQMTVYRFDDLAQQLVDMFPTESYHSYYVPRVGTSCPKGALYNKYLNMCRRLRRDGLLEYRIQRRSNHRSRTKLK